MLRDGVVSDELWDLLEPLMPPAGSRGGRPWNDHRRTLEGIIWRFRVGAPWRDLPEEFGPYQSVWQRHRLWSTDGTYARMHAAVRRFADLEPGEEELILSIDSTIVRAHQHAAGARRDSVLAGSGRNTGGRIESQESAAGSRGAA